MLKDYLNSLETYFYKQLLLFWELPKSSSVPKALEHLSSKHILKRILTKLTKKEFSIIRFVYLSKDRPIFSEIHSLIGKSSTLDVQEILDDLMLKGFLFCKKNSIKLNYSFDKYYIFPEIKKNLSFIQDISDDLKKEIKKKNKLSPPFNLHNLDEDKTNICEVLFKHGGIIPAYELEDLTGGLLKFGEIAESLIEENIIFELYGHGEGLMRLFVFYEKVYQNLKETKNNIEVKSKYKSEGLLNISIVIDFLLYFSQKEILLTQKGDLSRKIIRSLEKMIPNIIKKNPFEKINQKNKSKYIINLLKKYKWLVIESNQMKVSESGLQIMNSNYLDIIKKIYSKLKDEGNNARDHLNMVRHSFEQLFQESDNHWQNLNKIIADFTRVKLLQESNFEKIILLKAEIHHEIINHVGNCLFLGFFELGQNESELFIRKSNIGKLFYNDICYSENNAPGNNNTPCLLINSNFEVIVFPEKLDTATEESLYTFCHFQKYDNVLHFKITKESIYRAKFLNRNFDDFQKILNSASGNKVPQNIIFNISEWSKNIVDFNVKSVYLIQSESEDVLDFFIASKLFKDWQPQKICSNTVSTTKLEKKILEKFAKEHKIKLSYEINR